MSNISIYLFIYFVGLLQLTYGQRKQLNHIPYVTYTVKNLEQHELIIAGDSLFVKIPKKHLFPERLYKLSAKKVEDDYMTYAFAEPKNKEGIYVKQPIVEDFEHTQIKKMSKKQFYLAKMARPYVRKEYLDSIIKEKHTVFMVNGKELILSDTINFRERINLLLEKRKKPKIKVLDGKEGFEKYGAVGIKGVIEFSDRGCKKKKK